MDPIEARKQKLLAPGDLARRAEQVRRDLEARASGPEPAEDLEAEQRALGMRPCDRCEGFFLPDRSTEVACKRCTDASQRSLFAPLKRGSRRPSTDYDEAMVLHLARSFDLIARIVVALSTVTGVLVGLALGVNSAQEWILVVLVLACGFAGFLCGWLNVLAIRMLGQLSRCLVEIERSLERIANR